MRAFALVVGMLCASAWGQPLPAGTPKDPLTGEALVAALRSGGYVLFMRHAQQLPDKPEREKIDCHENRLAPAGIEQARTVGSHLRRIGVPVARVWASEYCRARQTATLLDVGNFEVTPDLNMTERFKERRQRITTAPEPGTNVLLVSHGQVEIAEVAVYRPDGGGGAELVARIKVGDWEKLGV
jgi:phosphohistidine phosphatase SixA